MPGLLRESVPLDSTTDKPVHPTCLKSKILMFLCQQEGKWGTWGISYYMPTVQAVFPVGTLERVQLRYMQRMQRRGYVGGCRCGCRGDYAPTEKGLTFLEKDCVHGATEVARWRQHKFSLGY